MRAAGNCHAIADGRLATILPWESTSPTSPPTTDLICSSSSNTVVPITGAYVLAGELARHGDHRQAFLAYEQRMRPLVSRAQKLPPGTPRLAHPKSRVGVAVFRTALRLSRSAPVRFVADRLDFDSADEKFELPHYDFGRR